MEGNLVSNKDNGVDIEIKQDMTVYSSNQFRRKQFYLNFA